jgi:GalNAc-alpha-(1->4)-GalNAc-alpha-(1->3)-diNAcBac-PP-undecaprenol alpha-1,4-N-acetyl-D-galactosaminyltransferase
MPRIVLVIGSLDCGGAQRALTDMANYWRRLDWEVTIATWSGPETADFYAVDQGIHRISLTPRSQDADTSRAATALSLVERMLMLRRILKNKGPDAVLSFIDVSNVLTIAASAGLRLRVVVAERTDPSQNRTISRFWKWMRRLSYHCAAAVVAQTGGAAQWLDKQCRIQSLVIPNAIREMPKLQATRGPFILSVGRLTPEKGVDTLLKAFARISAEFSEWRVVVAGDGPEHAALLAMRDQQQLTEKVDFLGEIRDVESWFARAGVVVHASRREGFPNVVLEAMAMGAPVVCTDCKSGPADLIRDRVNGRLIAVDDVSALAEALKELIENPGLRQKLASEALKVRDSHQQTMIMRRWNSVLLGGGLTGAVVERR